MMKSLTPRIEPADHARPVGLVGDEDDRQEYAAVLESAYLRADAQGIDASPSDMLTSASS
jgi:hypothetical protein